MATQDSKSPENEEVLFRESPFSSGSVEQSVSVGVRLREIRTFRGLSLRSLAKLSGLNINTLSLIENERTSPSVSTLQQLAQSLHVNITEFFENDQDSNQVVFQKQDHRTSIAFAHGAMQDLAAGMSRSGAEPIIVTLDPKASSGKKPIVHTGREFVYCLEGRIAYTVGDETYVLEPGDSLLFEAHLPHNWKNLESTTSRALLVLVAMDKSDKPIQQHFKT